MEYLKRLAKRWVFLLMIGVSVVVGRMIPAIYDWTGTDQSRMSPLVPQTAAALLVCGLITCLMLPWLRVEHDPPATDQAGTIQFSLRTILATMAVLGVFLAVFRDTPMFAISGGVHAVVVYYVAQFWILHRPFRWSVASLVACLYFPFAWIVSWSDITLSTEFFLASFGLPGLFFVVLVGNVLRQNLKELAWLSMALTSAELLVGVWLIRLGPRRSIAYFVFTLIASIFASFILHALMRA
jgi:hypothetical protein